MSLDIKEQIISASEVIKNKLKQLRDIEDQNKYELDKIFKPVTDPLTGILESNQNNKKHNFNPIRVPVKFESVSTSTPVTYKRGIESHSDSEYYTDTDDKEKDDTLSDDKTEVSITKKYLHGLYDDISIPFGVRTVGDQLMIGNVGVKLTLSKGDGEPCRIKINNNEYELSPGLKEVLLRKRPQLELVTENDKEVYKEILVKTNAHKRDYAANAQLKGDKGKKYQEIIKPMFITLADNKSKSGGNLSTLKRYKKNTEFIYWDDPNELVERLKLLIASKHAGNTSHDNEIISIIEELKEAEIIKT